MNEVETTNSRSIKVFKLDDYEWWAGETLADCIREARAVAGEECYPDAEEEGREITAAEMERLQISTEDSVFEDGRRSQSWAEELRQRVEAGEAFPQLFAAWD
jgi:hypothetical protein